MRTENYLSFESICERIAEELTGRTIQLGTPETVEFESGEQSILATVIAHGYTEANADGYQVEDIITSYEVVEAFMADEYFDTEFNDELSKHLNKNL
jgi:hypothetical protein